LGANTALWPTTGEQGAVRLFGETVLMQAFAIDEPEGFGASAVEAAVVVLASTVRAHLLADKTGIRNTSRTQKERRPDLAVAGVPLPLHGAVPEARALCEY